MSAELRCSDGTVVQISAETEAELRKVFGKEEYKFGDVLKNECGMIRVVLYGGQDTLMAFNGSSPGPQISDSWCSIKRAIKWNYRKIGNIFDGRLK